MIERIFKTTDAYLIEISLTMHGLFLNDLADFTPFDSNLTATFADDWLTAITAAESVLKDSAVKDQQAQLTEVVESLMGDARKKYNEVKYFASVAFPQSPAARNEFGLDSYSTARRVQARMVLFLEEMHAACVKYTAQLITAGYDQTRIDAIKTLQTALKDANTEQEMFKRARPTLTEDRVKVFNNCYNFTRRVSVAAQVIYDEQPAKARQYVYVPTGGSSTPTSDVLTGTVAVNSTIQVGQYTYQSGRTYTLRNTGTVDLSFALSLDGTTPVGTEQTVTAGNERSVIATDMAVDGEYLLATNRDATTAGEYEVTVGL